MIVVVCVNVRTTVEESKDVLKWFVKILQIHRLMIYVGGKVIVTDLLHVFLRWEHTVCIDGSGKFKKLLPGFLMFPSLEEQPVPFRIYAEIVFDFPIETELSGFLESKEEVPMLVVREIALNQMLKLIQGKRPTFQYYK